MRELEPKIRSCNIFSTPNFVVRVLIRFVGVAKVIEERNYILSFCSLELLENTFSEKVS